MPMDCVQVRTFGASRVSPAARDRGAGIVEIVVGHGVSDEISSASPTSELESTVGARGKLAFGLRGLRMRNQGPRLASKLDCMQVKSAPTPGEEWQAV